MSTKEELEEKADRAFEVLLVALSAREKVLLCAENIAQKPGVLFLILKHSPAPKSFY